MEQGNKSLFEVYGSHDQISEGVHFRYNATLWTTVMKFVFTFNILHHIYLVWKLYKK